MKLGVIERKRQTDRDTQRKTDRQRKNETEREGGGVGREGETINEV